MVLRRSLGCLVPLTMSRTKKPNTYGPLRKWCRSRKFCENGVSMKAGPRGLAASRALR